MIFNMFVRFKTVFLFSCLLFISFAVSAQVLPADEPVPGGIVKIDLNLERDSRFPEPEVYFQGNKVLVYTHNDNYYALVGIPLNAKPGEYKVQYTDYLGFDKFRTFEVKSKKYKISKITIKNKNMVNPDSKTQRRIANDTKKIKQAASEYSGSILDKLTFKQPVRGIPTTSFGAKRIINGQHKNPHSGMDIAAAKSTPVVAAAKGNVILADNFYLSGNMVAIDHGHGLITMYAHLSEILVKVGDSVDVSEKIGRVGSTGRVTGPHLHWTVKLNQTSVNPALFLESIKPGTNKGIAGL